MCDKYLKVQGQIQTLYFHNVNSNSQIIATTLLLLKTYSVSYFVTRQRIIYQCLGWKCLKREQEKKIIRRSLEGCTFLSSVPC